jgi:hypothetical protein
VTRRSSNEVRLDPDEQQALAAIVALICGLTGSDIVAALAMEECRSDAREFAQSKAGAAGGHEADEAPAPTG